MIETRKANIIYKVVNSHGYFSTTMIIPKSWCDKLLIDFNDREILVTLNKSSITLEKYKEISTIQENQRVLKIQWSKSKGGNFTPRFSIPKKWCDELGFTNKKRQAKISLRGKMITIKKA